MLLNIISIVISVLALLVSLRTLKWQTWSWHAEGTPAVEAYYAIGLNGPREATIVTVRNHGRAAAYIEDIWTYTGRRALGLNNPYRLEPQGSMSWALEGDSLEQITGRVMLPLTVNVRLGNGQIMEADRRG